MPHYCCGSVQSLPRFVFIVSWSSPVESKFFLDDTLTVEAVILFVIVEVAVISRFVLFFSPSVA